MLAQQICKLLTGFLGSYQKSHVTKLSVCSSVVKV